jgi:hypothetical protein
LAIPTGPDSHHHVAEDAPKPAQSASTVEIDIAGPLTFWIILLVIGVLLQLVIVPLHMGSASLNSLLTEISNWLIYLPGSVVLPLIVALMIGERVGATRSSASSAAFVGEVNALYTALVYIIAIVIIYLLFYYISPASLATITLTYFAEYAVLVPVVILLVLVPLISALSAVRHSKA